MASTSGRDGDPERNSSSNLENTTCTNGKSPEIKPSEMPQAGILAERTAQFMKVVKSSTDAATSQHVSLFTRNAGVNQDVKCETSINLKTGEGLNRHLEKGDGQGNASNSSKTSTETLANLKSGISGEAGDVSDLENQSSDKDANVKLQEDNDESEINPTQSPSTGNLNVNSNNILQNDNVGETSKKGAFAGGENEDISADSKSKKTSQKQLPDPTIAVYADNTSVGVGSNDLNQDQSNTGETSDSETPGLLTRPSNGSIPRSPSDEHLEGKNPPQSAPPNSTVSHVNITQSCKNHDDSESSPVLISVPKMISKPLTPPKPVPLQKSIVPYPDNAQTLANVQVNVQSKTENNLHQGAQIREPGLPPPIKPTTKAHSTYNGNQIRLPSQNVLNPQTSKPSPSSIQPLRPPHLGQNAFPVDMSYQTKAYQNSSKPQQTHDSTMTTQQNRRPLERQSYHNPLLQQPSIKAPKRNPILSPITSDLGRTVSENSKGHILLFHQRGHNPIKPTSWKWRDPSFVQVPFSLENKEVWSIVESSLIKLKTHCQKGGFQANPKAIGKALKDTILSYNDNTVNSDFKLLSFNETLSKHIINTLPIIVNTALLLPELLACPLPVLSAAAPKTLYLTKKLCCSFLANAFLCTFPDPRDDMPDFNFIRLFDLSIKPEKADVKGEKLMCFLNYFFQMQKIATMQSDLPDTSKVENCIVSFERKILEKEPKWEKCSNALIHIDVDSSGKIEDKLDMLQVDFANKIVGGGVLNNGSVMEEIRFSICPELIVARFFTAPLEDKEVLIVRGTQQFSSHSGYAASFKFTGSLDQSAMVKDKLNRMRPEVVCMDALFFKQTETPNQFNKQYVDRELYKCAAAFQSETMHYPVATGNWGCGAFNGDPELKFLIQWIAASEAEREGLCYHTMGDENQGKSILDIVKFLQENQVDVKTLYDIVQSFYGEHFHCDFIFDFVRHKVNTE